MRSRISTGAAVGAIQSVSGRVGEIEAFTGAIAAAVEEQTAAAQEIAKNVSGPHPQAKRRRKVQARCRSPPPRPNSRRSRSRRSPPIFPSLRLKLSAASGNLPLPTWGIWRAQAAPRTGRSPLKRRGDQKRFAYRAAKKNGVKRNSICACVAQPRQAILRDAAWRDPRNRNISGLVCSPAAL